MTYIPTRLHKILQTHSILLFNNTKMEIATGIFLRFKDMHFVLTASHISDDPEFSDIQVNLGIREQHYPMKKMDIWNDKNLDLCFFRLDESEVKTFTNTARPFEFKRKLEESAIRPNNAIAICGYSISYAKFDESSRNLVAENNMLTTVIIPPERWPKTIEIKNPNDHFLLAYGKKQGGHFGNQEGQHIEPMIPKGLSGAGVWLIDKTTENSENPKYSLFGIQTSVYEESQVLCGSFINPMIDQIEITYR